MISKNVKVEVALREEDRPIAFLVQMASQFESKILFETGNKQVNVKSMMGMMSLGLDLDRLEDLTVVADGVDEEEAIICADGRRLWRVLENVFGNASKYAMENTRVYVDVKVDRPNVQLSLKNISAQPLNISADELTERFIRGDVSRNTEGSGLGLSIAKDLVRLQGGEFKLYLDGDLFKVTIEFKMK